MSSPNSGNTDNVLEKKKTSIKKRFVNVFKGSDHTSPKKHPPIISPVKTVVQSNVDVFSLQQQQSQQSQQQQDQDHQPHEDHEGNELSSATKPSAKSRGISIFGFNKHSSSENNAKSERKRSATIRTTAVSVAKAAHIDNIEMPSEEEVNDLFEKAITRMDIRDDKKIQQLKEKMVTVEQKWGMVLMLQKSEQKRTGNVEAYVEKLKNTTQFISTVALETLVVELRTQTLPWLERFLELEGLEYIIVQLSRLNLTSKKSEQEYQTQSAIIKCIYGICNSEVGMKRFLSQHNGLLTITMTLLDCVMKTKMQIMLFLAIIIQRCNEGVDLVLAAFDYIKMFYREKIRFEKFVTQLVESPETEVEFKINGLVLLNAILSSCTDPVQHLSVQSELLELDVFGKLRKLEIHALDYNTQLTILNEGLHEKFEEDDYNVEKCMKSLESHLPHDAIVSLRELLKYIINLAVNQKENGHQVATHLLHQLVSNLASFSEDLSEELNITSLKVKEKELNNIKSKLKRETEKILEWINQPSKTPLDDQYFDLFKPLINELRSLGSKISSTDASKDSEGKTPSDHSHLPRSEELEQEKKLLKEYLENCLTSTKNIPPPEFKYLNDVMPSLKSLLQRIQPTDKQPTEGIPPTIISISPPPPLPPPPPPGGSPSPVAPSAPSGGGPPPPPPPPPPGGGPPPPPPPPGGGPPPPPPPPGGGPPPPPPPPGGGSPPPPPPPGGGPPPPPGMGPPPPPGALGGMHGLPRLPTRTPKVSVKTVHMDKIPINRISKTIFIQEKVAENTNKIEIETDVLEKLFEVKKKQPSTQSGNAPAQEQQQPEQVSLIDPKKSYNVSIQLKSIRMNYEDIREGIVTMNQDTFGSKLGVIFKIAPTEEEIEQVVNYDGDPKMLAEPEKFIYEVKDIPHLTERLEVWDFLLKYENDVAPLKPDLDILSMASTDLKENKTWLTLLSTILAITNFLNAKSSSKNIYGFKISTLLKLQDIKTPDGKSNILLYLVECFDRQKRTDLSNFYENMEGISAAKRISLQTIKETLQMMNKMCSKVKSLIQKYEKEKLPSNDKFLPIMKPFYEKASAEVEELQSKFKTVQDKLNVLAELYDEDKTILSTKPEDFFSQLDTFFSNFKAAKKKYQDRLAMEEKKKKSAQQTKSTGPISKFSSNLKNSENNALSKLKGAIKSADSTEPSSSSSSSTKPLSMLATIMKQEQNKGRVSRTNSQSGLLEGMEQSLRDGSLFREKRKSARMPSLRITQNA